VLNVVDIREDKCLLWVEPESDDIFNIVDTHVDCAFRAFKLIFGSVNVFFIICNLNHKRHIESILHPLSEEEWDSVAKMDGISAGTTTSVQVEWLFLFISIKNLIQISVAEENAAANKSMGLLSS